MKAEHYNGLYSTRVSVSGSSQMYLLILPSRPMGPGLAKIVPYSPNALVVSTVNRMCDSLGFCGVKSQLSSLKFRDEDNQKILIVLPKYVALLNQGNSSVNKVFCKHEELSLIPQTHFFKR